MVCSKVGPLPGVSHASWDRNMPSRRTSRWGGCAGVPAINLLYKIPTMNGWKSGFCHPVMVRIFFLEIENSQCAVNGSWMVFSDEGPLSSVWSDVFWDRNMPEQIELQAKLLNYFSGSNKSNINQRRRPFYRGVSCNNNWFSKRSCEFKTISSLIFYR